MTRLTAKEARELSGKTVDEKIDSLLQTLQIKAKAGKRELRTSWEHGEDSDLWVNGGYSTTKEWTQAKLALEQLGYKVTYYYKESQFVDMYTLIEW